MWTSPARSPAPAGRLARPGWLAFIPALWLASALRLPALFANTFHADEALFASWARLIAVWRDPLLLSQAVDKPPLLFYLQALFYPMAGPVQWAARMPDFIASLLLVPLVGLLVRNLTGDRLAAAFAVLLLILSPLAIQFSATAFTDPLLTLWLVAAAAFLVRRDAARRLRPFRPGWAGLCLGLALATKYQAALFLPLLLGLGWLGGYGRREWARAAAGLALPLLGVLLWAVARSGDGPGLLANQISNIGGLRLAWPWELLPRLAAWGRLWALALGPVVLAAAGLLLAAGLWRLARRGRSGVDSDVGLVALFVVGYLLLHWLWAVPVWDRYLLPLLPFVLLLLARGGAGAARGIERRLPAAAALLVMVLLMLPSAWTARSGGYPIGGSPGADSGATAAAALLQDAPYGTVLYDHWYSWQWRYHLFDKTVYVSWFPHPDALLDDLAVFGGSGATRLIVLPDSDAAAPVRRALAGAGYRLVPLDPAMSAPGNMVLYRLEKESGE